MSTATASFAEQAAYLARRLPPVILTTSDPWRVDLEREVDP